MRILVMSDTHGDLERVKDVLQMHAKAEVVFHLGDGIDQADYIKDNYRDKMLVSVKGNCDWYSRAHEKEILKLNGKKVFATHGHIYNVKFGYDDIYNTAREYGANILLFGHTHRAFTEYDNGLYVMNPGSLSGYEPTYGIIDITSAGVVMDIRKHKR